MVKEEKNGLVYFRFENLSKFPEIVNFVSTRKGGVSKPPFDELNLAFGKGDPSKNVLENRKRLFGAFDIKLENVVFCNQIHSDSIVVIRDLNLVRNEGLSPNYQINNADATITALRNLALVIKVADCVPILLYDPQKQVIAAVHSGWQGTVKKILTKTVWKMVEVYGTNPHDLVAGIGPSAGPESYEVGPEVIQRVEEQFTGVELIRPAANGKGMFDLWEANAYQLINLGLPRENIEIAGIDTMTNTDLFYSHRKQKPTGIFVAVIILR